ncbi:MAG TPA: alanine racemase [Solirubrobacteraceae bacterium]|nr:alanine racemase [Solirubrobacteraceae bacterium]
MALRALATVDLGAVRRNAARLARELRGAQLCAVVKADGYGHGAVPAARAALAGGASWLAVATAGEAAELRAAGLGGRILLMGALGPEELAVALEARADLVVWSEEFLHAVRGFRRGPEPVPLHVKLDTGMGRLGTRSAADALELARRIVHERDGVVLAGAMTHFATADGDAEFMAAQLAAFGPFAAGVREIAPEAILHAANSAATLRDAAAHFDLVRCGVALYGLDPFGEDPAERSLEPVLALRSYLAAVKPAQPGESAGYGRRFVADAPTWIGTAPIGYADGVRRALYPGGFVLVGGRRYPLAGTVSMDNITFDLGPDPPPEARVGVPVTVIGADGEDRILAEEVAVWAGTINYEIACGISARVPRAYEDAPADR